MYVSRDIMRKREPAALGWKPMCEVFFLPSYFLPPLSFLSLSFDVKVRILIFVLGHVEMEVMALAGIQNPKHLALWKCHLPFGDVHGRAQVRGSSIYLGKLFFHNPVPISPKLLEPWEQQCQRH